MSDEMTFRGLTLDDFQREAVQHIDRRESVVVSAATGTGKTLIADYMIDRYLRAGKEIIYTAPIKALSNQKYKDFKERYGEEKVGILTGDITINEDAPLRIMTTEIYRNMLLSQNPGLEDLSYVIFDEVHYLGDEHRGKVWEESFIFSPDHVRFLGLSATIPNADEFAEWIRSIKDHEIHVVAEPERAVPLHHMFYDGQRGFGDISDLKEWKQRDNETPDYHLANGDKDTYYKNLKERERTVHIDVIKDLDAKGYLPAIYFCFSRRKTQDKAKRLKGNADLVSQEERQEIQTAVRKALEDADEAVRELNVTHVLRQCLAHGIGFHHAGLLPTHKELVENLFERGLVKALFCTETFAVGVNMPAQTVCFDSLEKYDGTGFRYLHSSEYFQLAGRAGRRGIDTVGYSVCVVETGFADVNKIEGITSGDREPLRSQFQLSYNTVLNLLHHYTEAERDKVITSSFYAYQQGDEGSDEMRRAFENRKDELIDQGYIEEATMGLELTEKGLFAMNIYHHELLLTEMFCSEITPSLNHVEILILIGTMLADGRGDEDFEMRETKVSDSMYPKLKKNDAVFKYFKENNTKQYESFLRSWYDGCDFTDLLELTSMSEGDIFRYFRFVLDTMQQVRHASMDDDLKDKLRHIEERLDRDIIAVTL
jgi:superfamily II RNA helicase